MGWPKKREQLKNVS
jgi:hypothetical protein